jgi:hypothetical protein
MSAPTIADNLPFQAMEGRLTASLRNIFLTLLLTVATLALCGFLWRERGYEMLIVTMGWPHVLLGFVFYFGRVKRGEANARSGFALLTLLTLSLWAIHYTYAITGLIYLYFLYHAFRDEIFLFLQTQARHRALTNVHAVAGVGPLILLMLLIPQQQAFRQDLRRIEFSGAQFAASGWTSISFKPVQNSNGRDFYFYLQAPHTEGLRAFVTHASRHDNRIDGQVLVGDRNWTQASDLYFQPHYAGDSNPPVSDFSPTDDVPVLLTGGHRVGQTFRAERNDLDGIWLPVDRLEQPGDATQFVFHLASPPLLPYSTTLASLRVGLIIIVSAFLLWKLIPRGGQTSQLGLYLLVLAPTFAGTQMILKSSSNAGYAFPLIFQFVVIFHYWSWYVYSFDKQSALKNASVNLPVCVDRYERMLAWLRRGRNFAVAVVLLNLISGLGVFWYYKQSGPTALRYVFDYNYFLYFLVLHVTFSFKPKLRFRRARQITIGAVARS